jgi:hypothetical protein
MLNWRQNPARVAWVVLLTSFFACAFLAVAVPVGARAVLLHSTRSRYAFLEASQGTAQLWAPNADDPAAVTERRPVAEGSRIATDGAAKAVLTLSTDEASQAVLATVQLSPNTRVQLAEARSPRFEMSRDPHRAQLDFTGGRLFLTVDQADERDVQIEVTTPNGTVNLGTGAFDLTADDKETRVRVRSGVATVSSAGRRVELNAGERVNVLAGRPPEIPVSDTVNLIINGGFEKQLAPLWQEFAEVKPGFQPGKVELVEDDRRNAVRFSRRAEEDIPNRVMVTQTVNRDVERYDNLALRLDLKVLYQSVPGGGEKDSEYPVMVDLNYTDIYGKDLHWYMGFYNLELPPGSPYPEPSGERVPLGVWYTYESPNLFELLEGTRPARINSLTIYANGHDYESLVSDVALTVQ